MDIYINETTKHADLILPSPSGLETNHFDFVFNALSVRNVAKYSPQIFQPAPGSKYDWEIMKDISLRLMRGNWFKKKLLGWLNPDRLLDLGLKTGPFGWFKRGLSLKKLKANPHGIDLGALTPMLPKKLRTPDKKINAAPEVYVRHLAELKTDVPCENDGADSTNQFQLIGRRHVRSNNSWMHNSPRLVKGDNRCTLMMHTKDAERLNLDNGQTITVSSEVGSVIVPLEVTEDIMQGVVSLPHGYGHNRKGTKLNVAEKHAGVSINDLTSDGIVDPLTGNAAFSGQVVSVSSSPEVAA